MSVTVPFGYKTGWIAVRSHDPHAVSSALGLTGGGPCGWQEGIDALYGGGKIFVTSALDGWVLAAGDWMMGTGEPESIRALGDVIARLSQRFGEAQAFATHRVAEYHHWMRAVNGTLTRCFAWLGESGEVLVDEGERTPIEAELTWDLLPSFEWTPSEDDVMRVAGGWSLDPSALGEVETDGTGLSCEAPEPAA